MKAIDRVHSYIEFKQMKPSNFERVIGVSNGYLNTQKKRGSDLGESVMNKVLDNCPDMNPVWLLTGQGEMIGGKARELQDSSAVRIQNLIKEVSKQLPEQSKELSELQSEIIGLLGELNIEKERVINLVHAIKVQYPKLKIPNL